MADELLQQAYGYASLLADIPELKDILDKAVAEKWTPDMIQAAVLNSSWAKSKRSAQVEWELQQRLHPQDAEAQKAQLILKVKQEATQLGFQITDQRASTVAGWILNNGLSEAEADQTIRAEFHYDPKKAMGQTATQAASLKALAAQYMVPISDQTLAQWEDKILHGLDTEDSFAQYLRDQAKSMYPSLSAGIDAGHSTAQLLNPYQEMAMKELNVPTFDLMDPKNMGAFMIADPKTGQRSMMNLDQWQTELRTNPKYGWSKTTGAQNMAADFTQALLNFMEAV